MSERNLWKEKSQTEITDFVTAQFKQVTACPVDSLKQISNNLISQNCGECVICREGIYQIYTQCQTITQGLASEEQLAIIKEIADVMSETARCPFGKLVGTKILTLVSDNEAVFMKHIKRKRCDARICEKLSNFEDVVAPQEGGLLGGKRRRRRRG